MEIAENRFAVEVEGFECSVHVLIVHFETGFLKGKFNVIAVPEVGQMTSIPGAEMARPSRSAAALARES